MISITIIVLRHSVENIMDIVLCGLCVFSVFWGFISLVFNTLRPSDANMHQSVGQDCLQHFSDLNELIKYSVVEQTQTIGLLDVIVNI